jgi:hypothetical protein
MDTSTRLTTLERWLIVLLLAAAVVFGLLPLLLPEQFATFSGFPGNDPFIYRLAGAATFGYAVGLSLGLRQGTWAAVKLAVIAVLTFNLASLYACGAEIIHPNTIGGTRPVVYLIFATSIGFVALTATLLYRHRHDAKMMPNIASWIVPFIVLGIILSATFGLVPLLYPQFNQHFGFKVTDIFLYGQAGAATLGYAVMGLFVLLSRNWQEIRNPVVMGAIFNGLAFLASLATIALGESLLLPVLIAVASLLVTVVSIIALRTNGGTSSSATLASPVARS